MPESLSLLLPSTEEYSPFTTCAEAASRTTDALLLLQDGYVLSTPRNKKRIRKLDPPVLLNVLFKFPIILTLKAASFRLLQSRLPLRLAGFASN